MDMSHLPAYPPDPVPAISRWQLSKLERQEAEAAAAVVTNHPPTDAAEGTPEYAAAPEAEEPWDQERFYREMGLHSTRTSSLDRTGEDTDYLSGSNGASSSNIVNVNASISNTPRTNTPIPNSSTYTTTAGAIDSTRKRRRMWSEKETQNLMAGCVKYGIGQWAKILKDADFTFNSRSSIDLKDRFRTCFPAEYKEHVAGREAGTRQAMSAQTRALLVASAGPNSRKRKFAAVDGGQIKSTQSDDIMSRLGIDANGVIPISSRKGRNGWTDEEDAKLYEGYQKYGPQWAKIAKDPTLGLEGRRNTDVRDRFRNAYPEIYESAGFKGRAKGKPAKRSDPAPQLRSPEPSTPEHEDTEADNEPPIGLHTGECESGTEIQVVEDPFVRRSTRNQTQPEPEIMNRLLRGAPNPWKANVGQSPADAIEVDDDDDEEGTNGIELQQEGELEFRTPPESLDNDATSQDFTDLVEEELFTQPNSPPPLASKLTTDDILDYEAYEIVEQGSSAKKARIAAEEIVAPTKRMSTRRHAAAALGLK